MLSMLATFECEKFEISKDFSNNSCPISRTSESILGLFVLFVCFLAESKSGNENFSFDDFWKKKVKNSVVDGTSKYHNHLILESCGARFLAPRPRNAPLPFAPTRTGPKSSNFIAPTLDRPDYIFPGPDRPDYIFPELDRTGPKQYSINPKLANFRLQ